MKCMLLVNSANTASRTIYGVEVIPPAVTQAIANTYSAVFKTGNTALTRLNSSYEYKVVEVASVDEFINNYNQFYLNGTDIAQSQGYDGTINRVIQNFDKSYPYSNNMIMYK